MSPMALEPIAVSALPGTWRVEAVDHPAMPLWLAVGEDAGGELLLAVSLGERAYVEGRARRARAHLQEASGSQAAVQLGEYLAGARKAFDLRVALDPKASDFEREAWLALCKIPFGEVRSYGQQAKMLGKPGAARAVGRANSRNPIPIVVPCHRIIGSDGSLTGFAGGLPRKRWLLTHEGAADSLRDPAALPAPPNQLGLGF